MQVQKLSPRISLHTPEPPNQPCEKLVILCTWLDAQQRHISKYLQLHQAITPGANILLIETASVTVFKPYAWQRAALKPAAQFIIDNVLNNKLLLSQDRGEGQTKQKEQNRNKTTDILLHSCSNGGGITSTQLLILIRRMTYAPLSLVGIIIDSAPDAGSYHHTHHALVLAQGPSRARRAVVSLIAHAFIIPMYTHPILRRQKSMHVEMREAFLNREYVDTPTIFYVYSKNDTMTDWKHAVTHAQEARWEGWYVEEYKLEDSAHCAHIRSNPELYAEIVKRIWKLGKPPQAKL